VDQETLQTTDFLLGYVGKMLQIAEDNVAEFVPRFCKGATDTKGNDISLQPIPDLGYVGYKELFLNMSVRSFLGHTDKRNANRKNAHHSLVKARKDLLDMFNECTNDFTETTLLRHAIYNTETGLDRFCGPNNEVSGKSEYISLPPVGNKTITIAIRTVSGDVLSAKVEFLVKILFAKFKSANKREVEIDFVNIRELNDYKLMTDFQHHFGTETVRVELARRIHCWFRYDSTGNESEACFQIERGLKRTSDERDTLYNQRADFSTNFVDIPVLPTNKKDTQHEAGNNEVLLVLSQMFAIINNDQFETLEWPIKKAAVARLQTQYDEAKQVQSNNGGEFSEVTKWECVGKVASRLLESKDLMKMFRLKWHLLIKLTNPRRVQHENGHFKRQFPVRYEQLAYECRENSRKICEMERWMKSTCLDFSNQNLTRYEIPTSESDGGSTGEDESVAIQASLFGA